MSMENTYEKLQKLYDERIDIYKATADVVVPDMETAKLEADYILLKRKEIMQLGTEV